MGSLVFIGRSSSSSSKRLALAALSHFFSGNPSPISSNAPFSHQMQTYATLPLPPRPFPVFGLKKGFHSGLALRAGYAVADYSDAEEKRAFASGPSDEGLEISKLGISEEIVSALTRRGIERLFPIQGSVWMEFVLNSTTGVATNLNPLFS